MSLATSANRLISGVVAVATLPLMELLTGSGYFSLYALLTALSGR